MTRHKPRGGPCPPDAPMLVKLAFFWGQQSLVEAASRLAFEADPPAERVYCNSRDYLRVGLHRNGPETKLTAPINPVLRPADPQEPPRYALLLPDHRVPPGEVWVFRP